MTINKDDFARLKRDSSVSLRGFDYIELYVGNAQQAAYFYRTAFGFRPVGYAGLETGKRDRVSFVMEQGQIRLILTAAIVPDSPVAEDVRLHGDGVKDIAFEVDDATQAFAIAVERGATPVMEPTVFENQDGRLIKATIAACGHTVHSFTQRDSSSSAFFPNCRAITETPPVLSAGLKAIDHIAISVEKGTLDQWVEFYENILDFHQSHEEDISTEYSAMNSKVVQNSSQNIKFPIMEPALGRRKSQIEEYLAFNQGPGAQHVAFLSGDIVKTVRHLRGNDIEFLLSPKTYYQMLEGRIGKIVEDLALLRELNILVDRDQWGYLLQIFSKPFQSRPTLFVEIIQRVGAHGFGSGNIKALFEAVEREQAVRGNL
jgi:4-hydroxyphenylpyruvate dioxygenase